MIQFSESAPFYEFSNDKQGTQAVALFRVSRFTQLYPGENLCKYSSQTAKSSCCPYQELPNYSHNVKNESDTTFCEIFYVCSPYLESEGELRNILSVAK